MSEIQKVFDQINDLEGTITSLERQATPETALATEMALTSLRRRRQEYQTTLETLSERQLVDVCDYRIVAEHADRYPVRSVAGALSSFQEMFTAFFAAKRENRPRHKAIFDADIVQASTLNVGFAYSGSLGLVLYVPSDQLLVAEGDHDEAVHAIFELAAQRTTAGVRRVAEVYGRAAINKFHEWSRFHIEADLSADVKWKRGAETKDQLFIQPQQLSAVSALIEQTSEHETSVENVEGILVALDVTRHSFKLSFPDAKDIRGVFDTDFDWKVPHEIPGRYRAVVVKRIEFPLWSEIERTSWTLVSLEPLD